MRRNRTDLRKQILEVLRRYAPWIIGILVAFAIPALYEQIREAKLTAAGNTALAKALNTEARSEPPFAPQLLLGSLRRATSVEGLPHLAEFAPQSRRLTASFGHQGSVYSVVFSPDGRQLAVAEGNTAHRYLIRSNDLIEYACKYLPFDLPKAARDR